MVQWLNITVNFCSKACYNGSLLIPALKECFVLRTCEDMYGCSVFVVYTIFSSDTIYRISLRRTFEKLGAFRGLGFWAGFIFWIMSKMVLLTSLPLLNSKMEIGISRHFKIRNSFVLLKHEYGIWDIWAVTTLQLFLQRLRVKGGEERS